MGSTIRELSQERLQEIRESWEKMAGEDTFLVELASVFDTVNRSLSSEGASAPYRELVSESGETLALLELFDTKRGHLTKLLTFHHSPATWRDDSTSMAEDLANVYIDAFLGVIELGRDRSQTGPQSSFHEVKIYGRGEAMMAMLQTIHALWPKLGNAAGAETAIEGRWLRVTF